MLFRRLVRTISLVLFLGLLVTAVYAITPGPAVDIFLRLDPVLTLGTALSARTLSWILVPSLVVVLVTLMAGRIFCGYVCPMGVTLDGANRCLGPRVKGRNLPLWLPSAKYLVLIFILAAAACGVSLVFLAAPLPLITRFYGLLVQEVLAFVGNAGLQVSSPLWESLDWSALVYAQPRLPRFATQFFVLALFISLFALGRAAPRFWCRYLCPSGALLAFFPSSPWCAAGSVRTVLPAGSAPNPAPWGPLTRTSPKPPGTRSALSAKPASKSVPWRQ